MPHKRAKRSVRLSETAKKGSNLPPSSSTYNDAPRSASRILNSLSVQSTFRESGRTTSEDTGERTSAKKRKRKPTSLDPALKPNKKTTSTTNTTALSEDTDSKKRKRKVDERVNIGIDGIRPGETLGEYNRRVETILRPGVSRAIKDAAAAVTTTILKNTLTRNSILKLKNTLAPTSKLAESDIRPPREFAPIPAPRRLNDIVKAPPVLPHIRKAGGTKAEANAKKGAFRATGRMPLSLGQRRILEEERERVIGRYREMKEARAGRATGVECDEL